jgi:hypothetical protein
MAGQPLQAGVSNLGDNRVGAEPIGSAFVGASLQAGVSYLGQTYKPHTGQLTATASLGGATGSGIHVGQGAIGATAAVVFGTGHKVRTPYQPDALQLFTIVGGSSVGSLLRAGLSTLGISAQSFVEVTNISGVKLTDGYDVSGDDNILSIDPLTGSATVSERVHPRPGDKVETVAGQHDMYANDPWEIRYAGTIIGQGVVLSVDTRMTVEGQYWIKKTEYSLGGWASRMLADPVSWDALPEEGALTRLKRWFPNVDTSLVTGDQRAYLDSVLAPAEEDPGTSTLLDQARAFSDQTKFPVRTGNNIAGASSGLNLTVVPAVTFRGADPPTLYLPPASTWTVDADFLADQAHDAGKVQTVEVIKDFDAFIAGIGKQALVGGQLGLTFTLGATRVGSGGVLPVDVGVRAPAVINIFGATKVISQIKHDFSSKDYRSSLDLTAPAVIS